MNKFRIEKDNWFRKRQELSKEISLLYKYSDGRFSDDQLKQIYNRVNCYSEKNLDSFMEVLQMIVYGKVDFCYDRFTVLYREKLQEIKDVCNILLVLWEKGSYPLIIMGYKCTSDYIREKMKESLLVELRQRYNWLWEGEVELEEELSLATVKSILKEVESDIKRNTVNPKKIYRLNNSDSSKIYAAAILFDGIFDNWNDKECTLFANIMFDLKLLSPQKWENYDEEYRKKNIKEYVRKIHNLSREYKLIY